MSTHRIEVATDPAYTVEVGPGVLSGAPSADALLCDRAVFELHGAGLPEMPRMELEGGEGAKTLSVLGEALEFCAQAKLSRRSTLMTFGGGTIGDLGGLVASLFKRGMNAVHAPTTLLAQVDASVGGKTAINLEAGKNLAGTFHQPAHVLCDTSVLGTLPEDEWASGLGEVLKTALIAGEEDLAALEERAGALRERDPAATADTVAACVATKARVVAEDPDERGPRRALNLGHTFAHAIEHTAGYGVIPHGVAVAAGIGLALAASERSGLLEDAGLPQRVQNLARELGLVTSVAELRSSEGSLPAEALLAAFAHDKKGEVGRPEFVLVRRAGDIPLGIELEPALLAELLG